MVFLGYILLAAFSTKRLRFTFLSLVVIIAWGILGSITHASLIGFVVIIPCALLAYALVRWQGDLLKSSG